MQQTDDLTTWLTRILDEDAARAGSPLYCASPWPSAGQILAWIEADRQILELHMGAHNCVEIRTGTYAADWPAFIPWGKPGGEWRHPGSEYFEEDEPCPTVRLLALPHADRPGYREEWRP